MSSKVTEYTRYLTAMSGLSILDADQRKAQELWNCGDASGEGEVQKLNTIILYKIAYR
jgi:hypothetical protein